MTGRMTTAYAGSGDITEENVAATLNALLPDKLGKLFIPAGVIRPRSNPGLKKVIKWLEEDEMGVGPDALFPEDNLVKAMVARNEELAAKGEEPDELVLVMVPDPASGLDNSLIKEAHEAGIRVVDLTQAGDDIVPVPDEPDEPAAEEKPPFETDEPAAELPPTEPEPPAPAPPVDVAKQIESAKQAGIEAARAVREQSVEQGLSLSGPGITITLNLPQEAIDALAAAIVAATGPRPPTLDETTAKADAADAAQAARPITSAPSLSKDKDPQPEGTVVYYYDAEGAKYRPARGRKRDNEERVFLTPDEIAQAKEKGMIK